MRARKYYLLSVAIAGACLVIGLVGGIFVGIKRGIPFVTQREQWTIGIYRGESPFALAPARRARNPVLRAEDVTDVPAKFVADPFLIREDAKWYLFFEVYNNRTQQGDLAVATSKDARHWEYQQIIIDEPFHLSYPYVFKWQDDYYLIPESFETDSIRLYKATDFPTQWSFVTTLVTDSDFVDPSIVHFNDKWWLFASQTSNDILHLYHADDLQGPWKEHPNSPVVDGDKHKARPSGRVLVIEDHLYRFTMNVAPEVGMHEVWAYEVTRLDSEHYSEVLARPNPILKASGSGWTGQGMHQIDAYQIEQDEWIAAVDGFGKYLVFGLKY